MQEVVADIHVAAVKIADARQAEVLMRAFNSLAAKEQLDFDDDDHFREMDRLSRNMGCGCILCKLRYEYTWRKKERHRIYKRVTDDDFVYMTGSCANLEKFKENQEAELDADWEKIEQFDTELKEIAVLKTLIKNTLGYDKHKKSTRIPSEATLAEWRIQNVCLDKFI